MNNFLKISLIILLIGCDHSYDKGVSNEKEIVIPGSNANAAKPYKDSAIIVPDKIDQFSATIVYYESYIGQAYSKKDFDEYFEVNRDYLDLLIDVFNRKILEE